MNLESMPEICREKDIAQYLGCSPSTVRSMCVKGEMPHRRIRTHYRIMKQDFIEYLEAAKCQRKIEEVSLSGERKEMSGKLSGTKPVRENGDRRAVATARRLIKSSRNTKSVPTSEQHPD